MQLGLIVPPLVLGSLLIAPVAQSSFYPPDYVVSETCQQQGPVELCALNRLYSHYPRLRITYRGALIEQNWGRISAFVQLNGRAHSFRMSNGNYAESLTVGGPSAVRICKAGVPGANEEDLPPHSRSCQHTLEPAGSVLWEADEVPPDELDLFFFAKNGTNANAWDVQLAFVSDQGQWDSLVGQNYRFRFE